MILFFVVAAVLLLVVLALLLQPLFRRFEEQGDDRRGSVVGLGRNRLAELKEKRQSGEITEAEYAEQVHDLETQVADDLRSENTSGDSRARGGGRWIVSVVVVLVPLLSGLLYLALGQPRALIQEAPLASGDLAGAKPQNIDAMVDRLARRLEDNPQDPEGWFMLGRSYMALSRYARAVEAFGRLRELVGDDPNVLVSQATALAMAQDGDLSGEPMRLVDRALAQQPDHGQGLWLAATAAYQSGDYKTALAYYRRVEPSLDGEAREQVRGMIRELEARGEGRTAASADGAGASLQVSVSLAPSLRDQAAAGDTVFVFARAVNGPGMPLAVVKKTVAELPVTVTLDDSQAMTPELRLSEFDRVTVGARISSSGGAIAQPGDLEGESAPVATAASRKVEVTINRVVSGTN